MYPKIYGCMGFCAHYLVGTVLVLWLAKEKLNAYQFANNIMACMCRQARLEKNIKSLTDAKVIEGMYAVFQPTKSHKTAVRITRINYLYK